VALDIESIHFDYRKRSVREAFKSFSLAVVASIMWPSEDGTAPKQTIKIPYSKPSRGNLN
jgi:hypothetical protein